MAAPPVDAKILERIEKLLRMAGPSSGASEPERLTAATEGIKLFCEHDLVIKEREKPKRRRQRQPPSASYPTPGSTVYAQPAPPASYSYNPYSPPATNLYRPRPAPTPGSEWERASAPFDAICQVPDCGEMISRGDPVWVRERGGDLEFLHADRSGPCGW